MLSLHLFSFKSQKSLKNQPLNILLYNYKLSNEFYGYTWTENVAADHFLGDRWLNSHVINYITHDQIWYTNKLAMMLMSGNERGRQFRTPQTKLRMSTTFLFWFVFFSPLFSDCFGNHTQVSRYNMAGFWNPWKAKDIYSLFNWYFLMEDFPDLPLGQIPLHILILLLHSTHHSDEYNMQCVIINDSPNYGSHGPMRPCFYSWVHS